jgi:putative transposase
MMSLPTLNDSASVIGAFPDTSKTGNRFQTFYAAKAQARRDAITYIEGFCNSRRRHSALDYRRPNEVHYSYRQSPLAA